MPFKPLRFVTGQELHSFYSRLNQNSLIDTSTAIMTEDRIKLFCSYFIRGCDGNFYVLDELKNAHSDDSQPEFFYARFSDKKLKKVTREQLSSMRSPSGDLSVANSISLLAKLKPDLYNDSFPTLTCSTDIESSATSWCESMEAFYSTFHDSDAILRNMSSSSLRNNKLPLDAFPLDHINHFKIDLLNITFFQQERLHAYLLRKTKLQFKNDNQACTALNEWLQAIEQNNQMIKEHLESYRSILEEYRQRYDNSISLDILHKEIKSQQINDWIFYVSRIIVSLAMIIGLNWYSLGSLTILLLYTMFLKPASIEDHLIFTFVCLVMTWQESLLVQLFSLAVGFIVGFLHSKNKEYSWQLNEQILEQQHIEEYVESKSTMVDLLSHLDLVLKRIDNFLKEKQEVYSPAQEEDWSYRIEKVSVSLEKNNPSRPFSFKPCQAFSDITFFSNSQADNDSLIQEDAAQVIVSL